MKKNPLSSSPSSVSKSQTPCCIKVGLKRGPWTPEEDMLLSNYINKEGEGRWRTLPKRAGLLRCGKSCRLRWMNYLRPSVKRGHIAPDEEDLILRLHRLLGNRWSLIAGRIPGRTDNEIKNYWNTHLSKKLISQGIDPRTHKPLNPNPNSSSSHVVVHPLVPAPALDHNPNPNPSPNPSSSGLEVSGGVNEYFEVGTDLNSDGLMVGSQSCLGISKEEDDDMDYCNDDIFSSFLNSLINEDMFIQQQQQQQQQPQQNPIAQSDLPSFVCNATWEASSSAATEVDRRITDNVHDQF
eukprot:TRINITY_DN239_c0_g2_i1.p1 TRINITY_DN239_c0_g2~~TRINITY_DN239_c0_g2_i1.p1  ORF type:complete len:295 (-),score=40.09 TRINITY_DN239_c0_g2_i1:206-1090(-)